MKTAPEWAETPGKRELAKELRIACAIAHGFGASMSLNELVMKVLEHGLPSRTERDAIKAERLAGDDTTSSDGTE